MEAVAVVIVASATVKKAIPIISSSGLHSPPRSIINSCGLHSPPSSISSTCPTVGFTVPRAASAAAVTDASAAAATVRSAPWRMGTIACLFLSRLDRTLQCRVSSDTPRAAEHVSPSVSVHCTAGRSTCHLLFEFPWRLRVFFGRRLQRTATTAADTLAAGPAWAAGTLRLVLEPLDRPGCDDLVLSLQ